MPSMWGGLGEHCGSGEHKDGSVAKQKGAGQGVWGWEGRGACAGGTVGAEMVSGEGGKREVVKGRGGGHA